MLKFPKDLAEAVANRWENIVAGEYVPPELPPLETLKSIFETAYVAAGAPEEARYPQFNILVAPKGANFEKMGVHVLRFDRERALLVDELRRLAPASDFKKSAIWIEFEGQNAVIAGLADLGTSWHRARLGFTYQYHVPSFLIVQIDRPGRLKAFQGQFRVATLADGYLSIGPPVDLHLFLHNSVNEGLRRLVSRFEEPTVEHPRDFSNFWFTAHWNVFAAIANSISLSGHGGTLIIADPPAILPHLRIKYPSEFAALQNAFVNFINARNRSVDFYETSEQQDKEIEQGVYKADLELTIAIDRLAEAIRFIAKLASCDGGIVISPDFRLVGFGAEIRAEMESGVDVLDVINEPGREYVHCDIEQFGMRHRSAIKLASRHDEVVVLPISQDGPISAVWRKEKSVYVKKGVSLANMNMPWTGGL